MLFVKFVSLFESTQSHRLKLPHFLYISYVAHLRSVIIPPHVICRSRILSVGEVVSIVILRLSWQSGVTVWAHRPVSL